MGLNFLYDNGARRVREYDAQPFLLGDSIIQGEESEEETTLDYEVPHSAWDGRDVSGASGLRDWPYRPECFIDGKDLGRTVAWLQSREGYPVPVRLSEIGAVALRDDNGTLRRDFYVVERVVSLIVDLFPWDEVESFAIALQDRGFRLLPSQKPKKRPSETKDPCFDFERMRNTTQNRSMDEMTRLEAQTLTRLGRIPTIVDGRLEPRHTGFDPETTPVTGLIKKHSKDYLHPQGWRVFYNLRPRERTPAFLIESRNLTVVSWYVRLDGANGELPNWGIVRLEAARDFFEKRAGRQPEYLDRLSRLVCDYRSRDETYRRAPVTIQPIQRAEEKLGALFTQADTLVSHFYHLTGL